MKALRIFENETFGKVRTAVIDNEPWFVGKDVAEALGYADTSDAMKRHVDNEDKLTRRFTDSGQSRAMYIINESGLYSLVLSSKQFKRWVTSEILPTLRRTGTYSTKETQQADEVKILNAKSRAMNAEARLKTADCKRAELLYKLSQVDTLSKTYTPVLVAKAADIVNGGELIPLPKVTRKTYTATEVAEVFGVSANKIGRIATKHHLKTERYGEWYRDVAKGGKKEVDTFRYYECAISVFKRILEQEQEAQA